jgi:hypothetical protein
MDLHELGEWLSRLPVVQWVEVARNTLRQLGLIFTLLFLAFLVIYLVPAGFGTSERLLLLEGLGALALLAMIIVAILTILPGDLLYAPHERGRQYGTEQRPRRRRDILDEPKQTRPGLPAPPVEPRQLPRGGGD